MALMKAITHDKYGAPEEVLHVSMTQKPVPGANEVLVKIMATTINDYDWSKTLGQPFIYRLMFGLRKPKNSISGMELSGIAETIGAKVIDFKEGDKVFGDISEYGFGTFAEYISINEKALVKMPKGLSFEEACSIPHAGTLAFQALHDIAKIKKGQTVLINGGGGGVGTIAVQLAKLYDCRVTGVDSEDKLDMMTTLGFDEVVDYRKVNFTKTGKHYDIILDCKTKKSALSLKRALNPTGVYVTIGGDILSLINVLIIGGLSNIFSNRKLQILALKPNKDLSYLADLFCQKKLHCVLDNQHSFEEIPQLVQYFGEGKHKGKVVVKVNS